MERQAPLELNDNPVGTDATQIPSLIHEGHRRENRHNPTGLFAFMTLVRDVEDMRTPNFELWAALLDNGITSALLRCLLDEHFCGYSKDELLSWPDDVNHYLAYTLVCSSIYPSRAS